MISSTSNIKVKNIINLKKSAKARKKENCFLVEGPRMFFEIPRDRVVECYLTEEFAGKYDKELRGWNYELISENVCRHLSDTKTPQGVIAVVRREEPAIEELINKEKNPCFFLLESLQDPGNLGTIVRTAEGGRIGKLAGIASSALSLKPLITLVNGEIEASGIGRSRKKTVAKTIALMDDYFKETGDAMEDYSFRVGFGYDIEEGKEYYNTVANHIYGESHVDQVGICQIGATIAVHTGPYAIGIGCVKKYENYL